MRLVLTPQLKSYNSTIWTWKELSLYAFLCYSHTERSLIMPTPKEEIMALAKPQKNITYIIFYYIYVHTHTHTHTHTRTVNSESNKKTTQKHFPELVHIFTRFPRFMEQMILYRESYILKQKVMLDCWVHQISILIKTMNYENVVLTSSNFNKEFG